MLTPDEFDRLLEPLKHELTSRSSCLDKVIVKKLKAAADKLEEMRAQVSCIYDNLWDIIRILENDE